MPFIPVSTKELFEQAKVDHVALTTHQKLFSEADEKFKKSKQHLHNRLAWIFQTAINVTNGLQILTSKCVLAVLDEPAEDAFVTDLIDAIIHQSLAGPQEKETFFILHEAAMKDLDVAAFEKVATQIKKEIPVELTVDTHQMRITLRRG